MRVMFSTLLSAVELSLHLAAIQRCLYLSYITSPATETGMCVYLRPHCTGFSFHQFLTGARWSAVYTGGIECPVYAVAILTQVTALASLCTLYKITTALSFIVESLSRHGGSTGILNADECVLVTGGCGGCFPALG